MNIVWLIKPGLFIYECIKIIVIATLLIMQSREPAFFIKLILAAPGTLFPLMALFIWLDTSRYKAYLPLFAAGKCVGIFILMGWFIVSRQVTMIGSLFNAAMYIEMILLSGDLFALAAVLLIMNDLKISTEIPAISEVEEN
ncbi:MAG: hypothetical protein FWD22_03205 [Treponema sp.]|nr:hypothetical protein [Treponema sp.]